MSTVQRDLIINEFFNITGHISAEELHARLKDVHSSIGLATVYRTMKILNEAGLANERKFNDGFTRYEYSPPDDKHHDHIVCVSCGVIEEFANNEIESLQEKIARQRKFKMLYHKMEIYGLCRKCVTAKDEQR